MVCSSFTGGAGGFVLDRLQPMFINFDIEFVLFFTRLVIPEIVDLELHPVEFLKRRAVAAVGPDFRGFCICRNSG